MTKEYWEYRPVQKYDFRNIDLIRGLGEDFNSDPNYYRGLGWYQRRGEEMPLEWRYAIFQLSLSGMGRLRYHGIEYDVPAGSAFLAHSTDPEVYYWNPCQNEEIWHFIYLEISGKNIRDFLEEYIENFGPIFQFEQNSKLIQSIQSIKELQKAQQPISLAKQQQCIGLLKEMLAQSCEQQNSPHSLLIQRALQEINLRYRHDLSVNQLAQKLEVSREFLSREFSKHLAISPYQYIQKLRFSDAHDLLTQSSLSIKEIANRLAFSSATLFSRRFTQFYKITPSALRKSIQAR